MMRNRLKVLSLCVLVATTVSGCVLVPFVQAFKETGLTEGDRKALLPPQVKKFSDARLFGNKSEALDLVAPESRAVIAEQLHKNTENERIVKSNIDEIEWSEEAYKARVVIKVDSYKLNQLVVKTTAEEQRWEFKTGSGWSLTERTKREV